MNRCSCWTRTRGDDAMGRLATDGSSREARLNRRGPCLVDSGHGQGAKTGAADSSRRFSHGAPAAAMPVPGGRCGRSHPSRAASALPAIRAASVTRGGVLKLWLELPMPGMRCRGCDAVDGELGWVMVAEVEAEAGQRQRREAMRQCRPGRGRDLPGKRASVLARLARCCPASSSGASNGGCR